LRFDDVPAAWRDLLTVETLAPTDVAVARLRSTLGKLGAAEVRAALAAGAPTRAITAIGLLRDRGDRRIELAPMDEAARVWVQANEFADRGEFALALVQLDTVAKLLPGMPAVEQARLAIQQRQTQFHTAHAALHAAAARFDWPAVVRHCDDVLRVAPQYPDARPLRAKAWQVLIPETIAAPPAPSTPEPDEVPPPPRFVLWVDGVGGFLICLNSRVALGQATGDANVDVPLYADVSRLHAHLTRDEEGYVLEAGRAVQVNSQPTQRSLLAHGDRITLGASCQLMFQQNVPVSTSARLDLVSGHRLPLALDAVLLMADTLVLGPGPQTHVCVPSLTQTLLLYRHGSGLGLRHAGPFRVDGQSVQERGALPAQATVQGENFALAVEPMGRTTR
jgi:hypothetical protein